LIIFVFSVLLLLLPIGLTGICQLCDLIMISRAKYFQEQLMPAVYACLDITELAEGRPVLNAIQAENYLRSRFNATMPITLRNRLRIDRIELYEQKILPDPSHWMGGNQPLKVPVVVLYTVYRDHQGRDIFLHSAIELLTD
jgi:hypothetical protein